jgi:hypothetical protein
LGRFMLGDSTLMWFVVATCGKQSPSWQEDCFVVALLRLAMTWQSGI